MRKLKYIIVSVLAGVGLLAPLAVPGSASAVTQVQQNIENNLCTGATLDVSQPTGGECANAETEGTSRFNQIIRQVVNIFSVIVGVVAVVMIIIGGFRYITSGGESSNVSGAKNTILYAIIGLVIVALAQVIVRFVLGRATNAGA